MPRAQNFSQSTIYQIRCVETRKVIYVGSTTDFRKRGSNHKYTCNTESHAHHHLAVYIYIRENGGWDAYEVIPVEHLQLNSSVELRIAEQREIDRHVGLLNKNYAKRTKAEYRVDNKDKSAEHHKQYYIDNKDKFAEHRKQYYVDNKADIAEYSMQYRAKNVYAIADRRKVPVTCECGCIVTRGSFPGHVKSKKHQTLLDKINNEPIPLQAIAHDI